MWSALGHVLPLAVGVALSTVPVTVVVLILLSPARTRSAIPFGIGWVLGLAAVVAAAVLGGHVLAPRQDHDQGPLAGVVELVIGGALLGLALHSWRRPRAEPSGAGPRWLDQVGSLTPLACLGLGFVLNLRPKGLLLGLAAGIAVAEAAPGPVGTVLVLAVYVVLSASTVVVPVVLTLIAPARMQPLLASTRDWLVANSRVVTGLIVLLVALVVIGAGLAHL